VEDLCEGLVTQRSDAAARRTKALETVRHAANCDAHQIDRQGEAARMAPRDDFAVHSRVRCQVGAGHAAGC
jgi:hypothetical protein